MWSKLEEALHCSVCRDVFQEPVFLTCRHSFCKSCLQEWWSRNRRPECPLCRTISPEWDPPVNMALKGVCEAFTQQRAESQPVSRPDWQPPVNAGSRPSAAPRLHRLVQERLGYELELFGDLKGNYAEVATDIEIQARVTERQIEEVFSTLKKMLKREKQARINGVREEKEEKKQRMKRLMEVLKDDIEGLNEKTPLPLDLQFWQGYRRAARKVPAHLPELPQLLAGARIEADRHLSNLPHRVLDSMKNQLGSQ